MHLVLSMLQCATIGYEDAYIDMLEPDNSRRDKNIKILLVEDDPGITEIVTQTLNIKWPETNLISTSRGQEVVALVKKELPDIVILDLGLPDIDGIQVLAQIRSFTDVPVVIHTVRGEETDRISGLELGADDYMVKPFSPGELIARLKAVLRRSQMCEISPGIDDKLSTPSTKGKLRIDFDSEMVSIDNKVLKLSPREYELLYHLATNAGTVVSNEVLLEKVFPDQSPNLHFLKVYMNKLMEGLGENPYDPKMIIYEDGKGYKCVEQ